MKAEQSLHFYNTETQTGLVHGVARGVVSLIDLIGHYFYVLW